MNTQNLKDYKIPERWTPGASFLVRASWRIIGLPLHASFIPGSFWRKNLLKLFGAKIGKGGRIKPYTKKR